jgi:L-aminopeptidase/D-esterase-like protein
MQPLDPSHLVGRIDGVLLTGGSAFGLDAAAGVMRWMEERGRGFPVGVGVVPIVPAAVIFDLAPLGRVDARPTPAMAYEACDRASPMAIAEGSVGVGTGATVGKGAGAEWAMKGGVGVAIAGDADARVGALAVVNAFGDVRDGVGAILAGARTRDGRFADTARSLLGPSAAARFAEVAGHNTTLAVVATDTPLTRLELQQLARAASAALYRRITPAATSFDGDVVFALSAASSAPTTGSAREHGASPEPGGPPQKQFAAKRADKQQPSNASGRISTPLPRLEALAVLALEQAIERAVRLARGRDGVPGLADDSARGTPKER